MSDDTRPLGQPQDGPEYLEQGSGAPLAQQAKRSRKRPILIGGTAAAGLALVGGAVFAGMALSGGGAQPSQALPADTLAYLSVDLDPSASQKIEAIRFFRKFPTLKDEMGMEEDDDFRRRIFEEAQADGECDGVDYDEDIEPWLGERAAVAGVEIDGEPTAVGVVAIKDADAAEEGVKTLTEECGGDSDDSGAFVVAGDWAVVAETEEIADKVIDRAAESPLSDNENFTRWTGEIGDPGIMTMYAAPEAGQYFADEMANVDAEELFGDATGSTTPSYTDEQLEDVKQSLIASGMSEEQAQEYVDQVYGGSSSSSSIDDPEQLQAEITKMMEGFEGMGATIRFEDAGIEMEMATENSETPEEMRLPDKGGELVASLPEDTVAAFGMAMPEGWGDAMLDQIREYGDEEISEQIDEAIQQVEDQTSLVVPEDMETLAGEAMAIAIGGGFDPEALASTTDGSELPLGIKIRGDADEIEDVLDNIRSAAGLPEDGPLKSKADGDFVAIGPNSDFLDELTEDGGLGDSEVYEGVMDGRDDAGAVLFVNFNAGDDWLVELAEGDDEAEENLKPLAGLGISTWMDGSVTHANMRLTTD